MSNLMMELHQHRQLSSISGNENSDISPMSSFYANGESTCDDPSPELEAEAADELSNLLSLKLKKPKHWKWELTTSRSCSSIALPRILLYDHKGKLLVDANSSHDQIYKQDEVQQQRAARKRSSKAASANLEQSIRQVLDQEFNGLSIQEATPAHTLSPTSSRSGRFRISRSATSSSFIEFNTQDLPDYRTDSRSGSSKNVRFMVEEEKVERDTISKQPLTNGSSFHLADLPTPPSTTSTSSGPRQKRRYRRSRSSGRSPAPHSASILERFSFNRGRFSSPEYAEEQELYRPPRYILRTSKAGTLVVQEESFSRYRRRRKPKNSSSENLLNDSTSKVYSSNSLNTLNFSAKMPQSKFIGEPHAGSLQDVTELRARLHLVQPLRRYRSDGNFLLRHRDSSSEDEMQKSQFLSNDRPSYKKHRKNLVPLETNPGGPESMDCPTAR